MQINLRLSDHEAQRIDRIAERLGITRTELARRALLSGTDDFGKILSLAEWPLFASALRLVAKLSDDPSSAQELERLLKAIHDTKTNRNQGSLPGLEPA